MQLEITPLTAVVCERALARKLWINSLDKVAVGKTQTTLCYPFARCGKFQQPVVFFCFADPP